MVMDNPDLPIPPRRRTTSPGVHEKRGERILELERRQHQLATHLNLKWTPESSTPGHWQERKAEAEQQAPMPTICSTCQLSALGCGLGPDPSEKHCNRKPPQPNLCPTCNRHKVGCWPPDGRVTVECREYAQVTP